MCCACEDQDLIAAAWTASTGQVEQGPMLAVADRRFGFMVGYMDRLPVPSPTLARAYRRADAALRDVGAEPLWAPGGRYRLRGRQPAMDKCAEALVATFGPPVASVQMVLFGRQGAALVPGTGAFDDTLDWLAARCASQIALAPRT